MGSSFVEANFLDGNSIDGKASYYDSSGGLYNITTYKKGVKDGICINYYPDRSVQDSVEFVNGKEMGYWKHYDMIGNNVYQNFYYYGMPYGPELIFKQNRLEKFFFSDFNRKIIASSKYDSLGRVDTALVFRMKFTLKDVLYENKHLLNLFAYLPELPDTKQSFILGITNKDRIDKELAPVKGHNFFIDTLVAVPPAGWYYYLSCNLKADNDSINKLFIEEMIY